MKPEHADWITANVTETYGTCADVTEQMVAAFPDLARVRGHYYCAVWGERAHWWLLDGDQIVDPTAAQFPSKGSGVYVPWKEGAKEPTGMCIECGGYCYGGDTFCSPDCERSGMAYYNSLR
jgi:hypothetical protein